MYFLLQFRSRIVIYIAGMFLLVFHNMDSRMVCSRRSCLYIIWNIMLTCSDDGCELSVQLSLLFIVNCLLLCLSVVI
jgi:hypothetical protein